MNKRRPKIIVHNHFKVRDARDLGVGYPAHQAGVEAAAKGAKQGDNPHWPGSVEYEAWRRGFIQRHEENVKQTGRQFGQKVGGREAKLISSLLRGRGNDKARDNWYHHKQVNGYYILKGATSDEGRWLVRNGKYDIVKTASSQAEAESFAKRQPNGGAQEIRQIAADAKMGFIDYRSSGHELAAFGEEAKKQQLSKAWLTNECRKAGLDKEQTAIVLGAFNNASS